MYEKFFAASIVFSSIFRICVFVFATDSGSISVTHTKLADETVSHPAAHDFAVCIKLFQIYVFNFITE